MAGWLAGKLGKSSGGARYASKRGGLMSSTSQASTNDTTTTLADGSTISADAVSIVSGKDLNVTGSTIVGTNDVSLSAAHDVNITTSQDTQQSSSSYEEHHSGLMAGGGLSVSIGSSKLATTDQESSVTNNASTIGSLTGNVSISAGNDLHITGSDVIAANNVTGTAANITIDSATDTSHQAQTQQTSQSGLTIGLSGSLGDAINNGISQTQAAANDGGGDSRAAALHAIAAAGDTATAALDVASAIKNDTMPSIGIQVSVGSSHSSSMSSEDQATQRGSTVTAGGAATFVATGNGTPGSGNVTGFGISGAMQNAHGDGNSDAATQDNTHVTGSNSVTIVSGGDTNIVGADVTGNQVVASVGGNLNIASVQDTTTSAAHQSSVSGGFSITEDQPPTSCTG
jgi:filamentous hemagglutinin